MESVMNAGLKRLVVLGVGVAAVALNKKLGLDLGAEEQGAIAAMVVGFLLQSGYKDAKVKAAEAAATIQTPSDAAKELSK